MSPGTRIILIIWLDRGPGFHRIPSPAIAANELHNQRCNRILFEAGATVLIESVTCQRTTPRQISICRAVAVRVNVRATNANFPAIRNRQLPLINVLYITKSKSNKLVTRLLVYTKPTYNPVSLYPLDKSSLSFHLLPPIRFSIENHLPKLVAFKPPRVVSSSCCCSSTRSSTRNKRYDELPSLSNWRGTEGGRPPPIPEGIPLRRKTVVLASPSVLSLFPPLGKGGGGSKLAAIRQ